ncbi:hypothetical protein Tco_1399459 [Tanacetum coccineum]
MLDNSDPAFTASLNVLAMSTCNSSGIQIKYNEKTGDIVVNVDEQCNNNIHRRPDSAVHHTGDDFYIRKSQVCPKDPPTKKPSKCKLPQKVRKGKPTFQLVDEDDEAQQESIPQEEGDDHDLELAKKLSLEAHQEKGEGEGDDANMERAIKLSLDPAFLPQGRAPVRGVTIKDPVSETTSKLHEVVGKGKAVVTKEQVAHSLIDLSKKKRTTD